MSEAPKYRARFPFGLRSLLLLVVVVALPLNDYANRVCNQRAVVAEIEMVPSQVLYDYQTGFAQGCWRYVGPQDPPEPVWVRKILGANYFASVTFVIVRDLPNHSVTDETLFHISRLPHLRRLELESNQISDNGLARIAELKEFEELHLISSTVSLAGLIHLQSMPKLRSLNVMDVQASDDDVAKLRQALPNCEVTWRRRPTKLAD